MFFAEKVLFIGCQDWFRFRIEYIVNIHGPWRVWNVAAPCLLLFRLSVLAYKFL